MVEIKLVRDRDDAEAVYMLAYEFVDWLRQRYPEMAVEIDKYLEHQKFDAQIKEVLIHYNPPKGECLLATHQGNPIGLLMLKDVGDGICEMNRMFASFMRAILGLGLGVRHRTEAEITLSGMSRLLLLA